VAQQQAEEVSASRIRAVLLDVDGTLLDSNDAHARSWVDVLREFDIEPPPLEKVRRLIGMGGDKLLPEIADVELESELGERLSGRRKKLFKSNYLPSLQPTPGAGDLVRFLDERGVKLVVATSAESEELKGLLRQAGLDEMLTESTTSSDADRSKPDPDIISAALKKSGAPANEAILIGDTPYDLEAAARAGVAMIAVRSGGWGDEDFRDALAVYDDPADLLSNIRQSPLSSIAGS
jgi:HAD superfamily hydrolase (TIGR01509 family)